ncbi:hypothetical protein TW65_03338 [Stemphylium lycopersici]|nr:hypothetical protein TW65_03338 [Stemphylium lycopersici]
MASPEDSGTPEATPDSSTAQELPQAQSERDDMTKILQMMAASLHYIGNRNPTIATQLPPYPAETVPVFDGTNVTVFLERFEDMSNYYGFADKAMINRISAHCKPKQWLIIQSSNAYANALVNESWKDLREGLRKLFRSNDRSQQEARAEYFEHWLIQCQARSNLNIKEYLQEFQIRSKRCIEAATIDEDRRGYYLVKGLPFRQATKILERYSLRTDNPKGFDYKKISEYLTIRLELEEEARMLNPSEAIKEITPETEFIPPTTVQFTPSAIYDLPTAQNHAFQPQKLNIPLRNDHHKHQSTQSPPGKAPTNTEVDDLVNKMLELKINRASLELEPWKIQWTPRETELMNNPTIRIEVNRRTNDKVNSTPAFASQDGRNSQQPKVSELNPSIRPGQRSGTSLQRSNELLAQIKRRWLKQDIDPLTVSSPFKEKPAMATVENNAISVQLVPDSTGSLQEDDVDQFWKLSSIFAEDESDFRPRMTSLSECNNNTLAAATIARVPAEQKSYPSHEQSKVQKASQKTILRRPSNEHIPHLKGHKSRSEHLSNNRNINKDRIVQFREPDSAMEWETNIYDPRREDKDSQSQPQDNQARKKKLADKLEPDTRSVIKSILNTTVPLQIGTLLGNMPEVRKSLFRASYTADELEKFEISSIITEKGGTYPAAGAEISTGGSSESDDDDEDNEAEDEDEVEGAAVAAAAAAAATAAAAAKRGGAASSGAPSSPRPRRSRKKGAAAAPSLGADAREDIN